MNIIAHADHPEMLIAGLVIGAAIGATVVLLKMGWSRIRK